MKWETVKSRVAVSVKTSIFGGSGYGFPSGYDVLVTIIFDSLSEKRTWRESQTELADKCEAIINSWDIRCVGKLRDIFPSSFPRSLRTGKLAAEINEKGEWEIFVTK